MQYDSYSQEETHMVQAIVGANWGDEGKGKITDMLAEKADIIVRFQGGANAGHTIVNNYGKFALHTLPSGVFYSHTTSIIGNGVALDIPVLINELNSIVERGVPMPKLLISDRAQIVMPYHILFDKSQNMFYFRNVKTNVETKKDVSSLSFIKNMGKIYNIYDLYKKIYKEENPFSSSSSQFK